MVPFSGLPAPAHVRRQAEWPGSSSNAQQQQQQQAASARANTPGGGVSGPRLVWLLQLMLTYASATLLLLRIGSEPDALWRQQVPRALHHCSCAVFGTAFLLDCLAAAFHADSSRLEVTLLPAWVKGVPFVSSLLMATGHAVIMRTPAGKLVNVQRYICWMHTTPAVLYLIKSASPSITQQHMLRILLLHEVQLGMGAVAKLSGGVTEVVLGLLTHVALVPVIVFLHKGLKELGSHYSRGVAMAVYATTLATYASFGLVWDLDMLRLLSPAQEEAGFLIAEFFSKMLFSTALMFSNLRTRDLQRMAVMRAIEAASKQRLVEELSRRAAQKESFMSAVSHELRTPLNSIIGLSEAALHDADAPPRSPTAAAAAAAAAPPQLAPLTRQQLTLIRGAGERLLRLVNNVLDATALQHDSLLLSKQRVALAPLVKEVADLTRPLLRKGVVLLTRVPEDVEVLGDPDRIVQVLNNLLCNAMKFCESGSILVTARHLQSPGGGGGSRVAIAVQDTGLGIPQHKLNSIFQPFEQVHATLSRSQRGLGLGLSIVHKLVTAMGGEVSVTSAEQQGSTFTFTLPSCSPAGAAAAGGAGDVSKPAAAAAPRVAASSTAAAAAAAAAAVPDEDAQPQSPQHAGGAAAGSALTATRFHSDVHGKRQLLVTDDDPINHQVLSLLLGPAGYELVHVTSGPATLETLHGCAVLPDALLLDVSMPGMDGLEVCGAIRGMMAGSGWHLPIIMVTAQATPGAVRASMAAGADHHLAKPFTREQLLQAIESNCTKQRRPGDT